MKGNDTTDVRDGIGPTTLCVSERLGYGNGGDVLLDRPEALLLLRFVLSSAEMSDISHLAFGQRRVAVRR